ncbi:MAG TPA: hypothetical protein VNO52_18265 [Methylomirabilota bacterium]|nr:hypothetical protein [Methylomirabilota bacterium]
MKARSLCLALAGATLALIPTPIRAVVEWRVSVKFILGPSGQMPTSSGGFGTNGVALTSAAAVRANIDVANRLLANWARGYQIRLTEVTNVNVLSSWFNTPARNEANRDQLETLVLANKSACRWRDDAINIYINNTQSGICSFPDADNSDQIIFVGSDAYDTLLLHEIGHFFNVHHTHDGEFALNANGTPCTNNCACAQQFVGFLDGAADTIGDNQCMSRDQISIANYNQPFASLDATKQAAVQRVWRNLMSYHSGSGEGQILDVLTPDQCDIATDAANGPRAFVTTGKNWFVDRSSACISVSDLGSSYRWWVERNPPPGVAWGASRGVGVRVAPPAPPAPPSWPSDWAWPPDLSGPRPPAPFYPADWAWPPSPPPPIDVCFGGPYKTLDDGLNAVPSGGALTVRAGNYGGARVINKKVTLCGSRGTVALGRN